MTRARKAALQWFHDRGEVTWMRFTDNPPTYAMQKAMIRDGQLQQTPPPKGIGMMRLSLTDLGRRMLHEGPNAKAPGMNREPLDPMHAAGG